MDTIGKRIAAYRKKKNIKQDELAAILGVSPQAVSKWENDVFHSLGYLQLTLT